MSNIQETICSNKYENKKHAIEKSETNDHYNDQQNSMLLYIQQSSRRGDFLITACLLATAT